MSTRPNCPCVARGPLPVFLAALALSASGCRSQPASAPNATPAAEAPPIAMPAAGVPDQTEARAETIARIQPGLIRVGSVLPDLTFDSLDGAPIALASLRGRPTVLVFGSCTCEPFVESMTAIAAIEQEFRDHAAFVLVYIDEAHPTDGWAMPGNPFEVARARSLDDRRAAAIGFRNRLGIAIPIALETMDRSAERVFGAFPNRLVIADADGTIVSASTPGPWSTREGARTAAATLRSRANPAMTD